MYQLFFAGTANDRLQFPVRADDRVAGQPEDMLPDLPWASPGRCRYGMPITKAVSRPIISELPRQVGYRPGGDRRTQPVTDR